MENKFLVKKFIRDDGEQFEVDGSEIYLAMENTLLRRPDPDTSSVEYTEADGGEMVAQRNASFAQEINGLIVPKETDFWVLVSRLNKFWKINHTYKIIYQKKGGGLFSASGAWISAGLQIVPQPYEDYAEWNVGLTLGYEYWREYAENSEGQEIYANTVQLPLISSAKGGEKWDSVGEVWDEVGGVWTDGEGGVQDVMVESSTNVYPVWVVTGSSVNPTLQNDTTDTFAVYYGTVAEGQTLVVDFETGVAKLDGAVVTRNLSGIVSMVSGNNVMGFNEDSGIKKTSKIEWNNTI